MSDEGEPFRIRPYNERRIQWRRVLRRLGLSSDEAEVHSTGYERFRLKRNELAAKLGEPPLPKQGKRSALKNERRRERYRYAVDVLGLCGKAASDAAQSVKALVAAAPVDHGFPASIYQPAPHRPRPELNERAVARSRRYHECKSLGMPSDMASEGSNSDMACARVKREWAQIRALRGENDTVRKKERG